MNKTGWALFASLMVCSSLASADQASVTNYGGSSSGGAGIAITSSVAAPPGTLTINCPEVSAGSCSGGNITFFSSDSTSVVNGIFTSGAFAEGCSGGGKGGHVTCGYSFTGYFTGTWTLNSLTQAVNGVSYQSFNVNGPPQGTTAWNSAYTPFYYSDSEQILRSDDLQGTNQITYGTQGSGVGQFYGAYGIALDSTGRIYVSDTYNCRIVRIDNMKGANWTSYGSCGSGQGQFSNPSGIAIDSEGRIYVLDAGNYRIARIDNLTGSNWIAYGSAGAGVGQFAPYLTSLALDAAGHIYVADTGNLRVVRIDDMNGTNWTALAQSPPINGASYSFQSPVAVALDSSGRIYVADNESYEPAVIRVDDITGTNWTGIYIGASSGLNSIAVDSTGTVFGGGGGVRLIDNLAGVLNSSGSIGPVGSYYVFGVTPIPLPSPRPPAITVSPGSLTFAKQNINTSSASQSVTISNFGGSPLNFSGIATNNGFIDTNGCAGGLAAGSSCAVGVSFSPVITGAAKGSLVLADNSGNLGSIQVVGLSGVATAPGASVVPGSLTFPSQTLNVSSQTQSVAILNTGTGPLQVSAVTATASFSQTNNCSASIAPGGACTVLVSFTPTATGTVSGTLMITDNAGKQTTVLTGTGVLATPLVSLSPAALLFPPQLLNTTSAAQVITITNTGKSAVTNTGVSVTGDFAGSTTCGANLGPGKKCTVSVTFTPTAAGARSGAATINLSTGAQTVSLAGTGSTGSLPGALSLSPPTLTFSGYTIGDNPSKTVTVTNTSAAAVGVLQVAMRGAGNLSQKNNCSGALAPGASCSIVVTFRPLSYGTFYSAITVEEGSGAVDTVVVTATSSQSN